MPSRRAPLALTVFLLVMGGSSCGAPEGAGVPPDAQVLHLVADATAFDKTEIVIRPGPTEVRMDNQDVGLAHNLHVKGPGVDEKTELEAGPVVQRLIVTLVAGSYTYVCDIHPAQMQGTVTVR